MALVLIPIWRILQWTGDVLSAVSGFDDAEPIIRSKPTLYIGAMCPACKSVLMVAKETGIELDIKVLDLMKGEHLTEEFIKINPDHTIPTMVDNGFRLWESRAIMTYLVDKYASCRSVYPRNPQRRAVIDRLLYWDAANVFRTVQTFIGPVVHERKPAGPEATANVEKILDYIEKTLQENKFLDGSDKLTVADFSVSTILSMLELANWSFSRWPKVESWIGKMKRLPYYDEINPIQKIKRMLQLN